MLLEKLQKSQCNSFSPHLFFVWYVLTAAAPSKKKKKLELIKIHVSCWKDNKKGIAGRNLHLLKMQAELLQIFTVPLVF